MPSLKAKHLKAITQNTKKCNSQGMIRASATPLAKIQITSLSQGRLQRSLELTLLKTESCKYAQSSWDCQAGL